jgi:hypothetical protein
MKITYPCDLLYDLGVFVEEAANPTEQVSGSGMRPAYRLIRN